MPNDYFRFKQFTVHQDACAMKVTTDGCLFGSLIQPLCNQFEPENLLDIGTGTGLLSLMAAQFFPTALIDAVEIDPAAALQAIRNVSLSPWAERIRVVQTDVSTFDPGKKYDLIIANPPFYENEWPSPDQRRNIAHHQALLTPPLLAAAINRLLTPEGIFLLLLPAKKEKEWKTVLENEKLFVQQMVYIKQTAGHQQNFRHLVKGNKQAGTTPHQQTLLIKEGNDYSADFKKLLQPFYLYL